MVDAGEKGGLLAEILARLATYLENTARLRKKVKSAMMYPTVVTVIAIGITIFLLVKVVPVFGDIFSGFGAKLPDADAIPDQDQQVRPATLFYLLPGAGSSFMAGWPISRPNPAANSGIERASSCRSSDPLPTRFAWRASHAPWPP